MKIHCLLLCFMIVCCCLSEIAGELENRELLSKDRDLFKELRDKLTDLEKTLDNRVCRAFPQDKLGVTYTRWGRTICPNNKTELVYSGYVGGSQYSHRGAAVDYLCMPEDPDWDMHKDVDTEARGYVYGTEYEIVDDSIAIGKSYTNRNVPCVVCRAVGTSIIMILGKTKCHKSWTKQYSGYLMAGYYDHAAASQYIYVDKKAEKIAGSSADHNGKLLYPVEVKCGSLPCGPYVFAIELACVVCSK